MDSQTSIPFLTLLRRGSFTSVAELLTRWLSGAQHIDAGPPHALADSLTARDLLTCGQKWLAASTPFFRENERKQAGCQHRLFFAQTEYCDNVIFRRRAALDANLRISGVAAR